MDDEVLDGNAIGGMLIEVFGTEMTMAIASCARCGAARPVAELPVWARGPGTVVRCRDCAAALMTFVRIRGIFCVDLEGLASLA